MSSNFTETVAIGDEDVGGSSSVPYDDHDDSWYDTTPTPARGENVYPYIKIPSALTSIVCSIFVLQHVVRTRLLPNKNSATSPSSARRPTPAKSRSFPRFLVGLCAFDIISSSCLFLEHLVKQVVPQPAVGHWTCTSGGYVKIVGITCGSVYNMGLSLYFYVVVNRNWKEQKVARRLEPPMHLLVVMLFVLWTLGIPFEAYNPTGDGSGCWACAYPPRCVSESDTTKDSAVPEPNADGMYHDEESPPPVCIRGDPWGWILDLCTTAGFLTCVLVLFVSNMAIYCKVRKLLRANLRYTHASHTASFRGSSGNFDMDASGRNSTNNNSNNNSNNMTSGGTRCKAREVAVQSFLYCGGYLATYFLTFILAIAGPPRDLDSWWYMLLQCFREITFPLQGFFNMFAYLRPKYLAWREIQLYRDGFPSRWKTFREAITTKPLPDRATIRVLKRNYLRRHQREVQQEDSEESPHGEHGEGQQLQIPSSSSSPQSPGSYGVESADSACSERSSRFAEIETIDQTPSADNCKRLTDQTP